MLCGKKDFLYLSFLVQILLPQQTAAKKMTLATMDWLKNKKLHHLAAHVKGSQPPREIESTHPLLAHSLRFRLPVQAVVEVKALPL